MAMCEVIFCNVGTRKAPLGTRKNKNSKGASNSRKRRGPNATSSTTSNIATSSSWRASWMSRMAANSQKTESSGITSNGHRVGLGDTDAITARRSHSRKPTSGRIRKQ